MNNLRDDDPMPGDDMWECIKRISAEMARKRRYPECNDEPEEEES